MYSDCYIFILFFQIGSILSMEDINLDHWRGPNNDMHLAIKITNAYKAYQSTVVLNGLNMNVEKGTM